MKPFEIVYLLLTPFLPPLQSQLRDLIKLAVKQSTNHIGDVPSILDVGGRKSQYTIGVNAKVTISDVLRETDIQKQLNLGVTDAIVSKIYKRRSNIQEYIYDDMVNTALPSETFDIIVAVEVLEHVEADAQFIENVYNLLRSDGIFIMTTPNGDYITEVVNPDHVRHYPINHLSELLKNFFPEVDVYYAIKDSRFRDWGSRSWSIRRPLVTLKSMVGNYINRRESLKVKHQAQGTHHLVATARKTK